MKYHLVFCYNKKWWNVLSKLILWADKTDSSHCEILEVTEDGKEFFYGSVWPVSRRYTREQFEKSYVITHTVELKPLSFNNSELDASNLAHFYLQEEMGKRYSLKQIAFIGVEILLETLWKKTLDRNVNASKYLICTELCGNFMRDVCGFTFTESTEMLTLSELKAKVGL